jgi:hypothetical protein
VIVTSKFSAMPDGGAIVFFALFPYHPTSSEPSLVVVSDGAAIRRVFALYCPPCAWTGATELTPENAAIPPVEATEDEKVQLYEAGSSAPGTFRYSAWLSAAPPMLLSRLIRVQPAGAVSVPLPESLTVTTAIRTSPETNAGRGMLREAVRELAVVRSRSPIGPSVVTFVVTPPESGALVRPEAERENAPLRTAETTSAAQATAAVFRGRLPNMPSSSAAYPEP